MRLNAINVLCTQCVLQFCVTANEPSPLKLYISFKKKGYIRSVRVGKMSWERAIISNVPIQTKLIILLHCYYCPLTAAFVTFPLCTDSEVGMTTVNRCLDAAKACNVDDVCQKMRTEYVSVCIKPTAKSGLCNRPKCNKALRKFFDRVPADYTHELLFCPCTDTACAERRRQTIVPSCSYESPEKANCLTQKRICKADYVCRYVLNWPSYILLVFSSSQH